MEILFGDFLLSVGNLKRVNFEPSSKPKTTFCKCWASIKTKINMTSVSKEYEVKMKMVKYKMATAKNEVFIGL